MSKCKNCGHGASYHGDRAVRPCVQSVAWINNSRAYGDTIRWCSCPGWKGQIDADD